VILVCTTLSIALPASAVAGQASPTPPPAGAKWQVEVHGGGLAGGTKPTGHGIDQFPVGAALTPGGGGRGGNSSTRSVSSWYFGDGPVVLNSALGFFGSGTRMTPMDEALQRGIIGSRATGTIGARVSRQVTRRLSAEVDVTYVPSALEVTTDARAAIDATVASFTPAWNAMLATGQTSNRTVSSSVATDDGSNAQTRLTAGVRLDLTPRGHLQPYVVAGAGAVMNHGTPPQAVLTGRYRFDFAGVFPMDETDVVTIRAVTRTTPVVTVGGGAFLGKSPRRGLKVDVRIHAGPSGADTVVDAKPNVLQGSPAFSIFTGGDPGVQFSNNPSATGRQSSLSATTDGLKTLTDDGWKARVHFSVGYLFRF